VLVLRALGRRVGLCVTKIIDQQHVISKPIEGARILGRAGAFSSGTDGVIASATQREDGGVSLLIDVEWIIKAAEAHQGRAAA
jgi:chemotaxis protein histidine kinase CheA